MTAIEIPVAPSRWRSISLPWTVPTGAAIVLFWIAVAVLAPLIAPSDPIGQDLSQTLLPPGLAHWLGTDNFGRDVLARLIWGTRIDLMMGFFGVLFPFIIGVTIGAVAGYSGGIVDAVPVGAGAFVLKNWAHGDKVELAKNPNYWEASRVKLDGVQWLYVPDDNTRMLKLKAGEVDAAIFVPFNMMAELQKDPNIDVHPDPSSREDFMIINQAKKPLDDVKVRTAICQAIDREAIVKAVLFGNGKVANSFIPGGALYYNADNPTCKYDPDAAKKLLADAGASNLSFKLLINAGDSVNDQISVLIKNDLAKIGINIDIEKQESGQEWDSTVAGNYDLSIEYWTNDIIDPDEKATFSLYGKDDNKSFYTNYNNPHVTELIDQGRAEMDAAKRTAIYNEIQKTASTEVNWVDLYYSPFRNASRKNVKGFYQNPTGRFMLEDTEITQ